MPLTKIINDHVDRYIKEAKLEDNPDNRITALRKLKAQIGNADELSFQDLFNTIQTINSEIAVQRVKRHLVQLELF